MAIQTHHRIQCDGPECQARTAYHDDVSMAEDNAHAAGWHSRMPGKFSSEFEWHCPACKDKVDLGPENHGRWAEEKGQNFSAEFDESKHPRDEDGKFGKKK